MRFLLAVALSATFAGTALAETAPAPRGGASQAAAAQAAAPQATPPQAASPAKPRMTAEERFKAANTTGDGRLTYAQAQAKMPRVAHDFEAIDKDRKGHVTLADIRAYDAERRAARKAEKAAKAGQSNPAQATPAAASAAGPAAASRPVTN